MGFGYIQTEADLPFELVESFDDTLALLGPTQTASAAAVSAANTATTNATEALALATTASGDGTSAIAAVAQGVIDAAAYQADVDNAAVVAASAVTKSDDASAALAASQASYASAVASYTAVNDATPATAIQQLEADVIASQAEVVNVTNSVSTLQAAVAVGKEYSSGTFNATSVVKPIASASATATLAFTVGSGTIPLSGSDKLVLGEGKLYRVIFQMTGTIPVSGYYIFTRVVMGATVYAQGLGNAIGASGLTRGNTVEVLVNTTGLAEADRTLSFVVQLGFGTTSAVTLTVNGFSRFAVQEI